MATFENLFPYSALRQALSAVDKATPKTAAFIFCTGNRGIDETIAWYHDHGFDHIVLFITHENQVRTTENTTYIVVDNWKDFEIFPTLNAIIASLEGRWLYWGFNNEFLIYPYSDTRNVKELVDFTTGEQREQLYTIIVDVYPFSPEKAKKVHEPESYGVDKTTYFRRPISYPDDSDDKISQPLYSVYGGLRWRLSHLVESESGRLDRPCFFKASADLRFDDNGWCNRPDFHAMHAKTHQSPTLAVASLDFAQRLQEDPVNREHARSFAWHDTITFNWSSQELLSLGIIMPGQWF